MANALTDDGGGSSLTITRPSTAAPATNRPRMVITTGTTKFVVPLAPSEIQLSSLVPKWEETERPGTTPLLERTSEPLRRVEFSFTLFDGGKPVENMITALKAFVSTNVHVQITGIASSILTGFWRITDASVSSATLNVHNEITRARVSMQITQASDVKLSAGPATGGFVSPTTSLPASATSATSKTEAPATESDSALWGTIVDKVNGYEDIVKIAVAETGTPSTWRDIADQAGITDTTKIKPGTKVQVKAKTTATVTTNQVVRIPWSPWASLRSPSDTYLSPTRRASEL